MRNTEWLKTGEATEVLRVHSNTIYNLIKSGKLPAVKVGHSWRIPRSALFPPKTRKQC